MSAYIFIGARRSRLVLSLVAAALTGTWVQGQSAPGSVAAPAAEAPSAASQPGASAAVTSAAGGRGVHFGQVSAAAGQPPGGAFSDSITTPAYPPGIGFGPAGMAANPYGIASGGGSGGSGVAGLMLFSQTEMSIIDEMAADLRIMEHVVESAVGREFPDAAGTMRMGIPILLNLVKPAEPVYVEGYGAVFSVAVNFPLLGPQPAAPGDAAKPVEPDSEWERAKSELSAGASAGFGRAGASAGFGQAGEVVEFQVGPEAGPRYDADRVHKLRGTLLRALRNATHLRHVKPEDWIAVTVLGAPDHESLAAIRRNALNALRKEPLHGWPGSIPTTWWGANRHTIMSLRVKKEDVQRATEGATKDSGDEAFAQSLKTLEVATYHGPRTAAAALAVPERGVRFPGAPAREMSIRMENAQPPASIKTKTGSR